MNQLQLILLVLLLGAVFYAVFLWRKISVMESELRKQRELVDTKRDELEKVRKEGRDRRDETEELRKQLQEAKAKLKRQQKDSHETKGKKGKRATPVEREPDPDTSAAAIVRVTDQELEAEHRQQIERLEREIAQRQAELKRAHETIEKMKREEERRKVDAERAARALAGEELSEKAEASVESLKVQLDTLMRAAGEEKKRLETELKKSEHKARTALKRATNNHSLYLVVKGQLELAEDKLALLRRRYEGAKKPDDLRAPAEAPAPADFETEVAAAVVTEALAQAAEALADDPPETEAEVSAPAEETPAEETPVAQAAREAEEMPSAEMDEETKAPA